MDMNSSTINSYLESKITSDPAAEDTISNYDSYKYVFIPILLIQIIITVVSNGVLLMMIVHSFRSCTSLNIFLLSISIFNLLTTVNQISIVVFNFQPLTTYYPPLLCYVMTTINTSNAIGTILVHLFISYHRYKIAIRPLKWKKRQQQAWLLGILAWVIVCAVAVFECILHFNHGDRITSRICIRPGVRKCAKVISLYSQLLTLACLSVVSGMTCYFYTKASRVLKEIELKKESELTKRRSSTTINTTAKRKLTTAERAVVSLFTIFIIHCITQLPMYIYGIIVSSMGLHNRSNETADEEGTPPVSSVPILLLLATISFLTTSSPLVLCCINRKYKEHIKSIVLFISGSNDHLNKEKFLHQIYAKFPSDPTPSSSPVPPPKPIPRNIEIFYGLTKHSKFYFKKSTAANYIKSGNNLEVPGGADSLRPERASEPSLRVSRSPRPSRISTTSSSVGRAAVNAGLVLSAPGHRVLLNNFFPCDSAETMAEELEALNFL